eukprot:COSAG02_NODE_2335_length_9116_cov_5.341244_1_plen_206_part_00
MLGSGGGCRAVVGPPGRRGVGLGWLVGRVRFAGGAGGAGGLAGWWGQLQERRSAQTESALAALESALVALERAVEQKADALAATALSRALATVPLVGWRDSLGGGLPPALSLPLPPPPPFAVQCAYAGARWGRSCVGAGRLGLGGCGVWAGEAAWAAPKRPRAPQGRRLACAQRTGDLGERKARVRGNCDRYGRLVRRRVLEPRG